MKISESMKKHNTDFILAAKITKFFFKKDVKIEDIKLFEDKINVENAATFCTFAKNLISQNCSTYL